MNPDYYEDEITRLRLRLAEVELQRDAFKAMADKAVTDLIREVLAEQAKPKTDWESLTSIPVGYFTYDSKEATHLRQDDKITTITYSINGKDNVTKEQYEAYLSSKQAKPKPSKPKRRG
jgi:5'-deoxynucleotidase YfbR-like HD superfamily hydrolase